MSASPTVPRPRGPLSDAVRRRPTEPLASSPAAVPDVPADPFGDDLQLALWVLHYRGFADVPDALEWERQLLVLASPLAEIKYDEYGAGPAPADRG